MATSKLTLSAIKAYSIPLILFSAFLFFQLVVIPRSFPPSHYDVLGIKRYSSSEQVRDAYDKLSAKWNDGMQGASFSDFIKIQYAFELLMNPLWKRDYDIFGLDEQVQVIEKVNQQYSGARFSEVHLPLLEAASFDPNHAFDVISSDNFLSKLDNSRALLVQVFSLGSNRSAQFSSQWKRIADFLDGVANIGMVEVGDLKLATYLAEKKSTGEPIFRTGLPSLVAFPPGCRTSDCIVRYTGELSVDGVTDWIATDILSLPCIPYYSKESLVENFLRKGSRHKVKVIFVSKTGQHATPSVRQVVKAYWPYASYAFAWWREEDSVFWSNMFGVEDAPAIIIVKDPGVKPVVYHGSMNNSRLADIMEQNKHQVLPQLRCVTSMELGCDPKGYSRAGMGTMVWYCVVVAGRQSPELQKLREAMHSVQEKLLNDGDLEKVDPDRLGAAAATIALKEKRLTLAWLDGEAQQRYCFFYVSLEDSYDTYGTRRDITDVPRLYIVRYQRNDTEVSERIEKYSKNVFTSVATTDMDPTVQLVVVYKSLDGLLGLKNAILTASRGTAILNTIFDSYGPLAGDMSTRDQGSLGAFESGTTTSYALCSSQDRGQLFVGPGVDVYKGMIVGIHQRPGDLGLNVCKRKAATNVRSNKEVSVVLDGTLDYSLDDCVEYIQEDELVEITPKSVRMLKKSKMIKKGRITKWPKGIG